MGKISNPYFLIICEECNQQILSPKHIGIASYFRKDDDDPWATGVTNEPVRYVCKRCSYNEGYED